jgi:AraC-like DNA-binding protein
LEKRLLYAMHLLKHMGKTVADAAAESGFESPSHFSRAFRQRFNAAPGSIKQQMANPPLRVVNLSE